MNKMNENIKHRSLQFSLMSAFCQARSYMRQLTKLTHPRNATL